MTYRRRRSSCVNRLLPWLRKDARRCARFPAENARYPLFPLLCCTSRETVLGARPNRRAMAERPVPCARPRLIPRAQQKKAAGIGCGCAYGYI